MNILTDDIKFPEAISATKDGLLAIGGDLSPERLVNAYQRGIFPWFTANEPILWWSPNPRCVLFPQELHISKSMRQLLNRAAFKVTYNKAFEEVMKACAFQKRKDQESTWITLEMTEAYKKLHELGYAKSVEVWQDDVLVGGLYGVDVRNGVFAGESMFSKASNASKYGFISFVNSTSYKLIDCQIYTDHLGTLGAKEIPRSDFIKLLK